MNNQQSILITGAGGLVGSALCKTFVSAGWKVFGQVNSSKGIDGIEVIKRDLSKASSGTELVEQIGAMDCVINNAADQSVLNLEDYSSNRAQEIFQINLLSPIEIILAAKTKGARLAINISSIEALNTRSGHEIYGASKSALESATRSLALSLAPMRINGIRLGLIGDNQLENRWPEGFTSWTNTVPVGRIGNAEEVANLALALTSETFDFATGSIIDFDGGKSAHPGW
ncbi:MAG: SDR family oxidoreductase [Actinobacteria bacterium]|nr:SDR family oxidoreductase [Actinomycetota bacterium]